MDRACRDGDADRLIAVDHRGEIIDGDYIMAVCAQRQEPGNFQRIPWQPR